MSNTVTIRYSFGQVMANVEQSVVTVKVLSGLNGPAGQDGQGVPIGGTNGQVLKKIDATDFNTEWEDETGEENTINSIVSGEPAGSDVVPNVVSLTQAEFDAGTPIAGTHYIITDALPSGITKHSGLDLDDGTNPHGTTKTDVGLGNVPNTDFTSAVALNTAKVTNVNMQEYAHSFFVDTPNILQWVSLNRQASSNEYNLITGRFLTDSMITINAPSLKGVAPLGVAVGDQTINSFVLWSGELNLANSITHVSIFKATFTEPTTISSIAILYENSITLTNGYLELDATDFASTSILDKDLIYIFFGSNTLSNVAPNTFVLKCTID